MNATVKGNKFWEKIGVSTLNDMQLKMREAYAENDELILLSPTGSGKTLAFLIPILENLDPNLKEVQALIVVPARELAIQIENVLRNMGTGFKVDAVYGGRDGAKDKVLLSQPPAILIGTPGRLLSHIERENFDHSFVETMVLDEFDKSLQLKFDEEMSAILEALTAVKKKVLTSATFGVEVPDFVGLKNPKELRFENAESSKLETYIVDTVGEGRDDVLIDLMASLGNDPGIIFCNYKDTVDAVSEELAYHKIEHVCFHGGLEQKDRERALIQFRNGSCSVLVATDLAARGIDIPDLKYIIHYQLPYTEEDFIHRNGRTARMAKEGRAFVLKTKQALYDFINGEEYTVPERKGNMKPTGWKTIFISGGRKDKISKGDIVGLLTKTVGIPGDAIGVIELKRDCAFVGVRTAHINQVVSKANNVRLKKKKVRVSQL